MSRISSWREAIAVHLRVQEVAQEVVAALVRPLVDHSLEVGVDRVRGRLLVRLGVGVAELAADDLSGRMAPSFISRNSRQVVHRQAEHA